MKFSYIFVFLFLIASSAFAKQTAWEYMELDYDRQGKFMEDITQLGKEGWELTACPNTGYARYYIYNENPPFKERYISRSGYCVLKRQVEVEDK